MFDSADLIEALRKRGRKSLRPDTPPGEFPPGWQDWFDAMVARLGAVTGAAAEAFVALFLERELAMPPPRVGALTRWQAFATLWRQQWQPPAPEERRERVLAMAITVLVHVVLLALLLWIAFVRFTGAPPPRGEEVVQVEFIGQGTPRDTGGSPPGGKPSATPRTPAAKPAAPAPSRKSMPAAAAAPSQRAAASAQQPTPAQAATPQPLQVSAVPRPDSAFALPPPTPRTVDVPRLQAPELQVEPREVQVIEQAAPVAVQRPQLPTATLAAPILQPDVAPTLPDVQARSVDVPRLRAPDLQPERRDVPLHEPSPAAEPVPAATAQPAAPAAAPTQAPAVATPAPGTSSTPPAGPPATHSGTTPSAASTVGAGPSATKPGAWPSPTRNDDWGNANRNRPGATAGQPGLFDANGLPRLPPGTAAPGGGLPPGTVTEKIADLDRAGTWLKRPPIDYTPTRFDRFWTPNETLLEEWVRRNIRSVEIPIPGTSKKLHCVVSLLQLGGGCGIDDPNLQDQEAGARKPPAVPFKPALQDDQQSLRKP